MAASRHRTGSGEAPRSAPVVIEDSVPGGTAARAAGLRTFGFTGGGHCAPDLAERLIAAGAERVIDRMDALLTVLPEAFAERIAA